MLDAAGLAERAGKASWIGSPIAGGARCRLELFEAGGGQAGLYAKGIGRRG